MNIQNKKISVSLILVSICTLIIAYLIKEPNDYGMIRFLQEEKLQIPLYLYDINIIGLTLPYKSLVITFTILLCIGVYWFVYKTDDEIKSKFIKIGELIKRKSSLETKTTTSSLQEQTSQTTLYKKIRRIKLTSLTLGIIILASTFLLRIYSNEIAESLTTSGSQTLFVIMILLSTLIRAIAAQLCYDLTKYNRGNKYLWIIFGIIMPSISLITAGIKRTLQYEYKYLYEFINQPKIK